MYSRDINDSTYFTIVKMNGNHTPCYHYLEYCQKRLISNSAEPRAFLLLSVNPSSHPHPNKNVLKNKKRDSLYTFSSVRMGRKRPSPRRKCHSYEMNAGIFRGDFCPWQISALQTATHPAVGHSLWHHHHIETNQVRLYHSPCAIVIH